MKKGLSIIISITMIFAFAGIAMAAPSGGDAECVGCKGTAVRNIVCPAEQQSVMPFDYNESFAGDGYCTPGVADTVINICSCPDACVVQEGYVLGFKMEILTKGIYWARDPNVTAGVASGGNPADNSVSFRLGAKNAVNDYCNNAFNRQFNSVAYYRSSIITDANMVRPVNGSENVSAKVNDAKVISLQRKAYDDGTPAGYIISGTDTLNKRCQMRIDIPRMILNSAEYNSSMVGLPIQVRVSVYTENANTSNTANAPTQVADFDGNLHTVDQFWNVDRYLCPDCYDPCGCTITVANFCCDKQNQGLLFPYFAPDDDESYFWNGIVVNNLSNSEGTATFWIYEQDGDVGKATAVIDANSIYQNTISGLTTGATLSSRGTGDTAGALGNSKSYVVVCTTFDTDGFAMLSDRGGMGESMGYLPRNSHLMGGVPTVCGQ